ncbi:MAG: MBL fold metallo-hydrolase [Chloroflexi bacterium]|nr:MBL fold metallo-hydrolase [Chloroflexota bacterium]MQC18231.1 MBL fold metallo-hydrolase [Chloroflexota bacterium]
MTTGSVIYQGTDVTIEGFLGLGRLGNNCYVLRPTAGAGPVTIIDAPEDIEQVITALGDTPIERTVVTHSHFDHWLGFEVLGTVTDAPVYAGAEETDLEPSRNVQPLDDGDVFSVGRAQVQVIHTPGHTPGSICLLVEGAVLTGDTLFPGGPGRTRTADDLRTEVESIASRLLTLPPETMVLPGHGATTTVGDSQREYEVFASKEHDPDLHGDVLWLES